MKRNTAVFERQETGRRERARELLRRLGWQGSIGPWSERPVMEAFRHEWGYAIAYEKGRARRAKAK